MKKMSSLLTVFLLVFSLFVAGIQAQETEQETAAETDAEGEASDDIVFDGAETVVDGDDADTSAETVEAEVTEDTASDVESEEEEIEELEIEDVEADVTEMENARADALHKRSFYFLTANILTAEAVIDFLNENHPDEDTSALEEYKAKLEAIRESITPESDFEAVREEVVALVDSAHEELENIIETNGIERSDVLHAVKEHKDEATEDDEAKEVWGDARRGYAHGKATVVLAQFHNFEKVADHYSDSEKVEELRIIIEELESIAGEIATAAGSFDKETVDSLVAEAAALIQSAKEIAKEIHEEVRDAHKEAQEELREAAKATREAAGVPQNQVGLVLKVLPKDIKKVVRPVFRGMPGTQGSSEEEGVSEEGVEESEQETEEESRETEDSEDEQEDLNSGESEDSSDEEDTEESAEAESEKDVDKLEDEE